MRERPILFSSPMVRAMLDGRKTMTRRALKPQPLNIVPFIGTDGLPTWQFGACTHHHGVIDRHVKCPYGQPGDRLWVRETFMHEPADYCWEASVSIPCRPAFTAYRADYPDSQPGEGWKPSIHMPRELSRITLEVTGVRVERLQEISEADAKAEGCCTQTYRDGRGFEPATLNFERLWSQINGAGSWEANPFVWCISFRRIEQEARG